VLEHIGVPLDENVVLAYMSDPFEDVPGYMSGALV
jgi:hypothetical protein